MAGTLHYLPPVKPSAIALGTVYSHAIDLAVLAPIFGETYRRSKEANNKEEFLKSREAASAVATWGSSLTGSALQSYGVGALIHATGTLSYKGAAYVGTLVFFASNAGNILTSLVTQDRPVELTAINAVARAAETIGLSMVLTWWGVRPSPFD